MFVENGKNVFILTPRAKERLGLQFPRPGPAGVWRWKASRPTFAGATWARWPQASDPPPRLLTSARLAWLRPFWIRPAKERSHILISKIFKMKFVKNKKCFTWTKSASLSECVLDCDTEVLALLLVSLGRALLSSSRSISLSRLLKLILRWRWKHIYRSSMKQATKYRWAVRFNKHKT